MRTYPDLKPIVFAACLALASTAALAKPQPKQSGKPKPSNDICASMIADAPGPQELGDANDQRRKIIETASAQIGSVIDKRGEDGSKQGWEKLVGFYETSFDKPGFVKGPLLAQLKSVGKKPTVQPYSWCGIYATAMAKKAGVNVKWTAGRGPNGPSISKAIGVTKKNADTMLPGDIVVFKDKDKNKPLVHHALVERVDVAANKIYTIDGNLTCQQVARKSRPLSEVAYYYKTVP